MEVKNLEQTSFDEIVDCFLIAFENYYVKMPTDRDYFRKRWKAAKVDFNLSYGMYDKDKLVGFIIHAVDKRNGVQIAYNTGTGVIPEYRGRGIVKSMYEYVMGDLQLHGIERSTLEVITKNEKAIRAYKGVGFKIYKDYMCFAGKIETVENTEVELREMSIQNFDWDTLPNQEYYSWDFQKPTILGGNYNFYHVMNDGKPESYFIINPENKYVAQLDVLNGKKQVWGRLFTGIKQISDEVKIINVDKRLTDKLEQIRMANLKNTLDQYEMEIDIVI